MCVEQCPSLRGLRTSILATQANVHRQPSLTLRRGGGLARSRSVVLGEEGHHLIRKRLVTDAQMSMELWDVCKV